VWKATGADGRVTEALHVLSGGKLCGLRRGAGSTREPFWGRWERHGRFLAELHDKWMGDHNEIAPRVRLIVSVDGGTLELKDRAATSFVPAAPEEWPALASQRDERIERIQGLPDWCLVPPAATRGSP
jgi:hypothetical protein